VLRRLGRPRGAGGNVMMSPVGLRELKKNKLRQALEREALALFAEQGYEITTVEQIAARAEISTTTFYRYYSSKEDLVVSGADADQGLPFSEPLPPGQTPAEGLRNLIASMRMSREVLEPEKRDRLLARFRLIAALPELRALYQRRTQESIQVLAQLLAAGEKPPLRTRVIAAMVGGALVEAMYYWVDQDGRPTLVDLFAEALEIIQPAVDD
jgi:AcrR family transcriptional regulator